MVTRCGTCRHCSKLAFSACHTDYSKISLKSGTLECGNLLKQMMWSVGFRVHSSAHFLRLLKFVQVIHPFFCVFQSKCLSGIVYCLAIHRAPSFQFSSVLSVCCYELLAHSGVLPITVGIHHGPTVTQSFVGEMTQSFVGEITKRDAMFCSFLLDHDKAMWSIYTVQGRCYVSTI